MKQKLITIVLMIIVILTEIFVVPTSINKNYNILKFITLIFCGGLLLILLLLNYKTFSIDKKDILIFSFLCVAFFSTVFSSNLKVSIFGEENRYEGFLMITTYLLIYFCSKKYFKLDNIKIFFNIMFYVSIGIGILGILQRHISCVSLYPIFNKGICSTFGNSNFFGSFISIILPIAISFFIIKGSKKGFVLSLLMFFNLITSGTRSAWIAFIVVSILGLIYLIKQRNKSYFIKTGILILCFIIIFIYLVSGIGTNGISTTKMKIIKIKNEIEKFNKMGLSQEMGSGRIEIWEMILKLICKKPLLGCGVDNLKMGLLNNCPYEAGRFIYRTNTIVDKAHNEYLQIAATMGIPNLSIYLIFISMILFPKIKKMFTKKVYLLINLTIISYLVQAFFNISTIGVAPLLWMILGLSDNENVINKTNKLLSNF